MPPSPSAPVGWAVFARHVDDVKGVVNSIATKDFLIHAISMDWSIRATGWTTNFKEKTEMPNKFLGYNFRMFNDNLMCEISCMAVIESLFQEHSKGRHAIQPSHPYPMNIAKLAPGVRPPEGSPELASFLETQSKFRAGVGASSWVSRAHTTHTYPTNIHCGSMLMSTTSPCFTRCATFVHIHLLSSLVVAGRPLSLSPRRLLSHSVARRTESWVCMLLWTPTWAHPLTWSVMQW